MSEFELDAQQDSDLCSFCRAWVAAFRNALSLTPVCTTCTVINNTYQYGNALGFMRFTMELLPIPEYPENVHPIPMYTQFRFSLRILEGLPESIWDDFQAAFTNTLMSEQYDVELVTHTPCDLCLLVTPKLEQNRPTSEINALISKHLRHYLAAMPLPSSARNLLIHQQLRATYYREMHAQGRILAPSIIGSWYKGDSQDSAEYRRVQFCAVCALSTENAQENMTLVSNTLEHRFADTYTKLPAWLKSSIAAKYSMRPMHGLQ